MTSVPIIFRVLGLAGVALLLACMARATTQAAGSAAGGAPVAVVATWNGPIGPASVRYLANALNEAERQSARVIVLRLDTPGGLVTSMRTMIAAILDSPIPVVGFVAPPGAHAASAGTYIIYATHVAAMAPGTNIGAATPILMGGLPGPPSTPKPQGNQFGEAQKPTGQESSGDHEARPPAPSDAESAKAMNDAVAFIRSLAELRGRNVDWATSAVRGAASLSARQAVDMHVVDVVAADIPSLLADIDGRHVVVRGHDVTLATRGLPLDYFEPGPITRLLAVITNPNVALLLVLLGFYGLVFEFLNPGMLAPGFIGAMCLTVGLYALDQLPLSYAGVALLMLGLGFMVAEAIIPAYGLLAALGIGAFLAGAATMFNTASADFRLSWWVIAALAASSTVMLTLLIAYLWRSQRSAVTTGIDELVGAKARVIDWSEGHGHVFVHGERWQAEGPASLRPKQIVRVENVDGLTLAVRRA